MFQFVLRPWTGCSGRVVIINCLFSYFSPGGCSDIRMLLRHKQNYILCIQYCSSQIIKIEDINMYFQLKELSTQNVTAEDELLVLDKSVPQF